MKIWLFTLFVVAVLFGCKNKPEVGLPYFNDADFTPVWLDKDDPAYKKLHVVPSFALTDQNSHVVSEKTAIGKICIVNFFFTRCENICPRMMDNMKKAANAFATDTSVLIISHSVTPFYDNVAVLQKYARDKNITANNWHLVTGNKDQIYSLARKGYFADNVTGPAVNSQFLHTENFILVDRNRHIRGVYNGTIELEVDNLIRHIKMLEQEE